MGRSRACAGGHSNHPIHFVHGRPRSNPDGQLAAALAEVLLRGFSQPRVKRLVGSCARRPKPVRNVTGKLGGLNFLSTRRFWTPRGETEIRCSKGRETPDGVDHRARSQHCRRVGMASPSGRARRAFLEGRSLAIWRKGVGGCPGRSPDVTLAGLRVVTDWNSRLDHLGAASAVAARPEEIHLAGPLDLEIMAASASEDPLLPHHIIPSSRLDPLPVHQADRREFRRR